MRTKQHVVIGLVALIALTGCSTAPSTNITQPLLSRPIQPPISIENKGSIFQPTRGLALFEDRRARYVGDLLTVNLVETSEAKRKTATKEERSADASINVGIPTIAGKTLPIIGATTWEGEASHNQEFKDDETNTNSIKGSITVTVVEVLANGNLVVAGEKQLAINNDTDYIRLAGVVNPMDIAANGSVSSTKLANVQYESKNAQTFDSIQLTSMMARFFLTLLPF